jgi:hypothetical protein
MTRNVFAFGLLVALVLAVPSLASSTPVLKVTTTSGKTASFSYIGYEFSGGSTPTLGSPGKVEVDAKATSSAKKALLKKGALKSATLHVVATLPKKINKTYHLVSPKITSVSFEDGQAGPIATVKLSYKSLTD